MEECRMMAWRHSVMAILLLGAAPLWAAIETYTFDTPQQEALYRQLTEELRCLVCQNQNLADSNAELAADLRRKTLEMVTLGLGREAIVDYMVERYGDFVLYRPPVKRTTLLLWTGPALLLLIAVAVLVRAIRRQQTADDDTPDEAELARIRSLLGKHRGDGEP